jgi:peptidoglycan lytic transglycosylase
MPGKLGTRAAGRGRCDNAVRKVRLLARPLAGRRFACVAFALVAAYAANGCAGRHPLASSIPPPPEPSAFPASPSLPSAPLVPGVYAEQGVASWYGVPFHGRRAANGEIFDMNTMVAAHRTLPFGSFVRVTNLNNGKQTDVRIIDRGPFVEGRVLDLAHAAAVALGMIGTGTAPVRIELVSAPGPLTGEFTVQIGAFADRGNAERLRDRLLFRYQTILIQEYDSPAGHFYRVRVGRVSSPDAAQRLAQQLRDGDGFQTFVMRLDQSE